VKESMKKIFLACIIIASISSSVFSQSKEQDIIKFLEVSNTKLQAAQMFDLMLPNLKSMAPEAPLTFWTMFKSKLDIDSFINLFIPVYDKYFSHDDIKQLIQFYESPIGKKLLDVNPLITHESYRIGEEWGQKLALDILDELMRQGYY
jgi:hypothetical protein